MRIVWLFPIIGMLLVAPAQAAPIVLQDQHVAYGIQDVLVDEVLYDVTFRFGSYSEVFTIPPLFISPYSLSVANGNGGIAMHSSLAVGTALQAAQVAAVSDGVVTSHVFMNPWTIDPEGHLWNLRTDEQTPYVPYLWIADIAPVTAVGFDQPTMYVVFTESTGTPEPGTLLMLGVGGLVAGALRRRVRAFAAS